MIGTKFQLICRELGVGDVENEFTITLL